MSRASGASGPNATDHPIEPKPAAWQAAHHRNRPLRIEPSPICNVDNVADKRYWAGGGTRLAAGMPRTFKLSYRLAL